MNTAVFFLLFGAALCIDHTPEGYKLTPFGLRPAACVLEVPGGSRIVEENGGVRVYHPEGEFFYHAAPECHEDNAVAKYLEKKALRTQVGVTNGWLDYAGWYPPTGQNNLDSFIANYTVPKDPTSNSGQVLFYFIGMQDNAFPAVNIVQPVLTWGNGVTGWNMASWDCCPSNITVQSKTVSGLQAGDLITGTIKRVNSVTWYIDCTLLRTMQNTTLYAQPGSETYDWADVTLEVYYIATCNEFANGPMTFTGLALRDVQQDVLTPKWTFTAPTLCTGVIKQTDATTMYIQHG